MTEVARVSLPDEAKVKENTRTSTSSGEDDFRNLLMETEALALYVARHGDVLPDDTNVAGPSGELLAALSAAKSDPDAAKWQALMQAYAKLSAITYKTRGVNGRTILDTRAPPGKRIWKRAFGPRYRAVSTGVILFAVALVLEWVADWAGSVPESASLTGLQFYAQSFVESLGTFLIPAAWGGIGGCVYLMKRLSDKLFDMAFEEARVRGDMTRVFLGAMLGVIVVVLFFPEFGDKVQVGDVNFGPATAAFLAGLGVKPVYAAFETLSDALSQRLGGRPQGGQD